MQSLYYSPCSPSKRAAFEVSVSCVVLYSELVIVSTCLARGVLLYDAAIFPIRWYGLRINNRSRRNGWVDEEPLIVCDYVQSGSHCGDEYKRNSSKDNSLHDCQRSNWRTGSTQRRCSAAARAISIQAQGIRLFENNAIAPSAARLC